MCVQSAFLPPHLGLKSFALCVQNQGPDFRLLVTLVEGLGPHSRHALGPLRGEPFLCPQSQRRCGRSSCHLEPGSPCFWFVGSHF